MTNKDIFIESGFLESEQTIIDSEYFTLEIRRYKNQHEDLVLSYWPAGATVPIWAGGQSMEKIESIIKRITEMVNTKPQISHDPKYYNCWILNVSEKDSIIANLSFLILETE